MFFKTVTTTNYEMVKDVSIPVNVPNIKGAIHKMSCKKGEGRNLPFTSLRHNEIGTGLRLRDG